MDLLIAVRAMREEYTKIAAELTSATRAELPKKDFAVTSKKSNTGKPAYPIPDARSALGFAKMHGDTADYAAVRAKVEKKFPGLIEKKEGKTKEKEKDSNMGAAPGADANGASEAFNE